MVHAKRIARRLALGLAGTLVTVAAALGVLYGLAQTETGRHWAARGLETMLSRPGEREVTIGRLAGRLPQAVRLSDVGIADRRGPWLSLQAARLDWRPLDLLSGRLGVTALEIDALRLDRLPDTADRAPASGGLPTLPVELAIERFQVAEVALGPEVLGEAATFAIHGRAASDSSGVLSAVLAVARSDGVAGRIDADARYLPAENHLTLSLTASEPPGGLIARSLDIAGLPAVEARLAGAGPLAAWNGRLEIELAGLGRLKAALLLAGGTQTAFRISGAATSDRTAETLPWRLLAGRSSFRIEGLWRDPAMLVVERARLDGPAGRIELAGSLDTRSLDLDAKAEARIHDHFAFAELIPNAKIEGLTLAVRAHGSALAPALSVEAKADMLKTPDLLAEQVAAEISFTPDDAAAAGPWSGRLSTAGRIARLTLEDAQDWQPVLGHRLQWRADGHIDPERAVAAKQLTLETEALRVTGRGSYGLENGDARAALAIAYPDLSRLAATMGPGIEGRAELDAELEMPDGGGGLSVELSGELQDLGLAQPFADALLAGRSRFEAALSLDPGGGLVASDVALVSNAARFTGTAALSAGFDRLEADYRLEVPDLAVLDPAAGERLAGALAFQGRAEGEPASPALSGELTIAGAAAGDHELGTLRIGYTAENVAERPSGRLDAQLDSAIGRFEAGTRYRLEGSLLHLDELTLSGDQLHAAGRAEIPLDGRPATAEITAKAENLAPWAALAGWPAEGRGRLHLALSPEGQRQAAKLGAELGNLAVPLEGGDTLRLAGLTAELTGSDLTGERRGTLKLTATGLALGELALDRVDASAEGDTAGGSFDLSAAGQWSGPLEVAASGAVSVSPDVLSLQLARLEGRALGQSLQLRRPTELTRGTGSWELTDLELAFGGARLEATGRLDAERIAASLTVETLPLAVLAPLRPTQGVSGVLSGRLDLGGSAAKPEGRLTLTASQFAIDALPDSPPLDFSLEGDWREGRARMAGRLSGLSEADATLAAELPLRLAAGSFVPIVPADDALSAKLDWRGPVDALWALAPITGHSLGGTGQLRLEVAGTPARPEVTGQLALSDGTYENFTTGTLLRDVELRVDLDGERATIESLAAGDGASGSLSAVGSIALLPERGFPLDITTELENFTMLRRDDVTSVSEGKIRFEGTLEAAFLRGDLETKSMELRIPDRLPAEVIALDVTEAAPGPLVNAAAPSDGTGGFDLGLDLAVEMPGRVFLRGRGLDSEWAGRLEVSGSADQPVIEGKLTLVRGQIASMGKTFALERGSFDFVGGKEIDPLIDMAAVYRDADYSVTVSVSGPISSPDFQLSSDPALPEDEIVARILFGKSTAKLSALEAVQLAAAVSELSAGTGGVLDGMRSALHVDTLRVGNNDADGEAEPEVEAGKYVTDDVYIGVRQGTTVMSGAVEAEVELTPNISVETGVGQTGESNIGIKFKWDY